MHLLGDRFRAHGTQVVVVAQVVGEVEGMLRIEARIEADEPLRATRAPVDARADVLRALLVPARVLGEGLVERSLHRLRSAGNSMRKCLVASPPPPSRRLPFVLRSL
jgi:hypothetical protein